MTFIATAMLVSYCLAEFLRSMMQSLLHAAAMGTEPTLTPTTVDRAKATAGEKEAPAMYDYFELDELRLLLGLMVPQPSLSWCPKGHWLGQRVGNFHDLNMVRRSPHFTVDGTQALQTTFQGSTQTRTATFQVARIGGDEASDLATL
jgi:hypothetical protein